MTVRKMRKNEANEIGNVRNGNESNTIPDIDWGIESDGEGATVGSIHEKRGLKWQYRDD